MDIGMLWFDNDKKATFEQRVERATTYYYEKYGKRPDLCFVHPDTGQPCMVGRVEVRTSKTMLPNHFWIGVRENVTA